MHMKNERQQCFRKNIWFSLLQKGSGAKHKSTTECHMTATQIIVFIFQPVSESVVFSVEKWLIMGEKQEALTVFITQKNLNCFIQVICNTDECKTSPFSVPIRTF